MTNAPPSPPVPDPAISEALANVPSAERAGNLTVPAPRVTVSELTSLKLALEYPRQKPDRLAVAVSAMAAGFFGAKVLVDLLLHGSALGVVEIVLNVAGFMAAIGMVAMIVVRYREDRDRVYPFHDQALKQLALLTSRYRRDDWT